MHRKVLRICCSSCAKSCYYHSKYVTFHRRINKFNVVLPTNIYNIYKQRNILRRPFLFFCIPTIKSTNNKPNNKFKKFFSKKCKKTLTKFFENLSSNDNYVWKSLKKLNKNFTPIPLLTVNNVTTYSGEDNVGFSASNYRLTTHILPALPT